MRYKKLKIKQVALTNESKLRDIYQFKNLEDAFSAPLPEDSITDPEALARFLMDNQAPWVSGLMAIRDVLVSLFGLKTAKYLLNRDHETSKQYVHYFRIFEVSPNEIVMGVNDKHLDFRLSLLCQNQEGDHSTRSVVLCTVVKCHNFLGKIYLTIVAPIHRAVVCSGLRRATKAGWPTSPRN